MTAPRIILTEMETIETPKNVFVDPSVTEEGSISMPSS